ncbi:hypothetical protein, partial [Vibrio parahaemolyticus]|uniref:hypothetical protein n=1 Tax=Vibrio parahaemolyticus TaxID=670 RepID=UPI000B70BA92
MDIILSLTLLLGMRGGGGHQAPKKEAYSPQFGKGPKNNHQYILVIGAMFAFSFKTTPDPRKQGGIRIPVFSLKKKIILIFYT